MANAVNYLAQIQTGQTIQASHVNQFVNALSGSEAYDLVTSGSYTIIGPLYATASWATNALNANSSSYALSSSFATTASHAVTSSYAVSGSKVFIADNRTASIDYTLVFKNSTASPDDYHQLATDPSNGPYYNPSTNVLGGLGGLTVSGSIGRFTSITGSFLGNINGSSSYATTASYALTSSYAINGVTTLAVGAFQDGTSQTVLQNTSGSITFDTTDISDGVSLGSPTSRIIVTKAGTYNFQFSLQIAIAAGAGGTAYIWLRKNGVNLTNTNTGVYMQNSNDKHVAAWNFMLALIPGDYLELVMWAQGADIKTLYEAPVPGAGGNGNVGVPSAIATVTQIK